MNQRLAIVATCVLLMCTLASCATHAPVKRMERAQHSAFQALQGTELTAAQIDKVDELCPFGMPQHVPGWDHGFTEFVVRDGYALEHSGQYRIPLWVCERLVPEHLTSAFPRKDHFRADPELSGPRAELGDYKGSGYARGHHAPAEDQAWSKRLLDESFYLSNMSPQLGGFNSGVWSQLEKRVRLMAADSEVTWVITGALLYDPDEEHAATADGWVEYFTIGAGVAVPTHLFKIVVSQKGNGDVEAVAFVIANAKPPSPYAYADFIKPVRWIEERSGFDFMPELEPAQSQRLEATAGQFAQP
ncbi:DNA/RNA non-specific endonuclease [Lysobacter sp. TAF61]|uniref:DNA/RNA non-specific endonuclease n=1 Tax=Lysobacter sp. TAF61 TaxID=3233072 RepID=UPI003F9654FF